MYRVIKSSQDIFGMARVGEFKNKGTTYEIYVNTNDGGNIPHFHFRDSKDWDKFHTCIRIDSSKYFHHTGKEDVLNTKQKKLLQDFMESKVMTKRYQSKFINNWELVCFLWDINNSNVQVSEDAVQPDYNLL